MAKSEKRKATVRCEMKDIWKSYEYLIREKLVSLDNMTRAMITEMKTFGASDEMIAEYLPYQFERLKAEVVKEQSDKYDRPRTRVG